MGLKFITDDIMSSIAASIREKATGYVYLDNQNISNYWSSANNMSPSMMSTIISSAKLKGYKVYNEWSGAIFLNGDGYNMRAKWQGNTKNNFIPFVGDDVTDIQQAFNGCVNIDGDAMCGGSVVYADNAYRNCYNMHGNLYMGNNVQFANSMCFNCNNLTGDAPIGGNITYMERAYHGCSNLNGVTKQHMCIFTYYQYNERIDEKRYGQNLINLSQSFANCYNLHGDALGFNFDWLHIDNLVPYPNLTDMYRSFYECQNLDGNLYVGPNVSNLVETFYNCSNLKGYPLSTNLAASMAQTYYNCQSLTGVPKVGPLVTNMLNCYYNCTNITGVPVINNNVTIATGAYYNCQNLTGTPVIGPKVTTMADTFHNCRNMTGTADIPATATNIVNAFRNCTKLGGVVVKSAPAAAAMANAFNRDDHNFKMIVIFNTRATFTNGRGAGPTGCTMGDVVVEDETVKVPYTYSNGYVYGHKIYTTKAHSFNEEYNLYMYALT